MRSDSQSMPGGIVGTLGPFAVLAASAAYLAVRWNDIPERFVIHWGTHGPNGWATRSIPGVFGPLIIGALVCAFITGLRYAIMQGASIQPAATARTEYEQLRGTLTAALVTQFMVVMLFALFAVILPFRTESRSLAPIILTVTGLGIGGMMVVLIKAAHSLSSNSQMGVGGRMLPAHDVPWKWGVCYHDAQNPALFVPKRYGLGYTLNFGHPRAWFALAALLLFPIAIIALTILLQHATATLTLQ